MLTYRYLQKIYDPINVFLIYVVLFALKDPSINNILGIFFLFNISAWHKDVTILKCVRKLRDGIDLFLVVICFLNSGDISSSSISGAFLWGC